MAAPYSKEGYTTLPSVSPPNHHLEHDAEKAMTPASGYGTVEEKRESDTLFRSRAVQTFERRALETIAISLLVSVLVVATFTLGACLVLVVF